MPEVQPRGRGGAPGQGEPENADAPFHVRPQAVSWTLGLVAVGLAALSIVQHLVAGSDAPPVGRINLDTEISIPTWFQVGMLLLAGGLTALVGASRLRVSDRYARHWLVAAGILVYLSMDEALAIHEELIGPLGGALDTSGIFRFAWVIPGLILVALVAAVYLRFLLELPRRMRTLLLIAGACYVGGGLGAELIDGAYSTAYGVDNLGYHLLTDFEEALEMAGLLVLIYALLWYLGTLRISVRFAG